MIGQYDIKKDLFRILNRELLTNFITGRVYKDKKPMQSELEDVVINVLDFRRSNELQSILDYDYSDNELQQGTMNINIYCKNIRGIPNEKRLNDIYNKIQELLSDNIRANKLFTYRIENAPTLLSEMQQNSMSYYNIKLTIFKY